MTRTRARGIHSPPPVAVVIADLEVRVYHKPAEVLGALGLPATVGGYQVNIRVAPDTPKGSIPIQLNTGNAADLSVRLMVQ